MPRTPTSTTSELRRRADHLDHVAGRIEHASVLQPGVVDPADAPGPLALRLLERNIVQLGIAVVELHETATRLRHHADAIDRSTVGAVAT